MLSSEIGSEGLDLQFCKTLINYDLPWNPMKVEQRIGRVDRFGQESDYVTIRNFVHENTIDDRIWERLTVDFSFVSRLWVDLKIFWVKPSATWKMI